MSKHRKMRSWIDAEFTKKTALEIKKREWQLKRAMQGKSANKPKVTREYNYAYCLKRDGRLVELAKWHASQKRVAANWATWRETGLSGVHGT